MSPPAAVPERPAFEALRARLSDALSSGADPRLLLRQALEQLRSAAWQDWLDYARALVEAGAAPLSAALLGEALRRWPRNPELRFRLGNALRLSQRQTEAEAELREVLRLNPEHEPAALSLAFMLRDAGRIDAACKVIQTLWRRQRPSAEAALKAGKFLEECGRPQLASVVYEEALADSTNEPRLLAAAGDMAMILGDFERGRERLLAALEGGVGRGDWSGISLLLANNQRYDSTSHPDIGLFERLWSDAASGADARIAAGFALGKARSDIGDFAGAVDVLRQANALQCSRRAWSAPAWSAYVDAQLAAPPPLALPDASGQGRAPLFIVGLPRTGTSLAAELLGRHPQVRGRGELNWLPFLAHELASQGRTRSVASLRQAASIYLAHLHQDDAPASWYIDKNPHNFRHLGLIASLFPGARIIHCVRERRDVAVSIWSQLFAHQDLDYAYDLGNIAAFGHGHDRLMQHWRRSLDLPLFELEYERLVGQTEETLRQLAGFLGLQPYPLLQTQPRPDSVISTASVWQARQPVHRGGVGRWRRFAPHLPELARHFGTD